MNQRKKLRVAPLLAWDLYLSSYYDLLSNNRKQLIIERLNVYKEKFDWDIDFQKIIDEISFEAIVLTNNKQQIQYVSQGFSKMTGYSFSYSKGKTPKFLQGEKTCSQKRAQIRESIRKERSIQTEVINYRKNGDTYNCMIILYPLRSKKNGVVTHFIALEREIA